MTLPTFRNDFPHPLRLEHTVGLLIFAVIVSVAELIINYESRALHSQVDAEELSYASELRARSDRELNAVLYLSSGLEAYLSVRKSSLEEDEIKRILAVLLHDSHHIRNLGIAVDYTLRYIYPEQGNEKVIGLDYRNLPTQWPSVQRAIDSGNGVLFGPINLVQGGRGLIYRKAIYIKGKYWGLLSTVIDVNSFVKAAFGEEGKGDYEFAVRSKDGEDAMLWGSPALFQDPNAVQITADVPGSQWSYAVRANNENQHAGLLLALRIMGWLLALVAGFGVYSLLRHRVELAGLAMKDALTGLPNRRLLNDRLMQSIYRHARSRGSHFGILFIDLNGFKEINDRYGHKVGDILLSAVAQRISREVRTGDTVARLGGDEFVVILEDIDIAHVNQMIVRLRKSISGPLEIEEHLLHVGTSIGMALYPDEGQNPNDLLSLADERMYLDKQRQKSDQDARPGIERNVA